MDTVFAFVDCEGRSAEALSLDFASLCFFPESCLLLGIRSYLVAEFSNIAVPMPLSLSLTVSNFSIFLPQEFYRISFTAKRLSIHYRFTFSVNLHSCGSERDFFSHRSTGSSRLSPPPIFSLSVKANRPTISHRQQTYQH